MQWDVSEGATFGPVASTRLTKVTWLGKRVVVIVTELGVGGVAPGAMDPKLQISRIVDVRLGHRSKSMGMSMLTRPGYLLKVDNARIGGGLQMLRPSPVSPIDS
ncbi:hypothetical protein L2E82_07898 [Cichorium intybus]|uniref:Uncharacterized protein n=1 Tax=Cichorium intybus TaxID=13427 RepID=A0ACB9G656_CICIN|nr:hypothetical protein L2E82_07898 [Cichorium intybus]